MPTHIDHIVTEIVPHAEPGEGEGQGDQRWMEKQKIQGLLKQEERQQRRLRAEAFDD